MCSCGGRGTGYYYVCQESLVVPRRRAGPRTVLHGPLDPVLRRGTNQEKLREGVLRFEMQDTFIQLQLASFLSKAPFPSPSREKGKRGKVSSASS